MFVHFPILVVSFIVMVNCQNSTTDSLSTLRFVNMIFRHGDRSPARIYPKNPIGIEYWPQKTLGWLTPKGEQKMRELGEYIRKRYDGFLNESYYHDEIKIWSSDEYRTVMSAHLFLDGLYNSTVGPIIPVMTVGLKSQDNLLYLDKHCPRKLELRQTAMTEGEVAKQLNKEYANLFRFLENETGVEPIRFGFSSFYIIDCLECQEAYGLPLPDWYKGQLRETLLAINDINFVNYAKGDELKRLSGGPLLERCTQTMKSKQVPGIYKEKFHIYSAHDSTITTLFTAMDIFNGKRPGFSSAILMELHEVSPKQFSVQILYKNDTLSDAYPLTQLIKGCSSDMCPFAVFEKGIKDGIPKNWEAECGLPIETECSTMSINTNKGYVAALSIWLEILAVLLCCLETMI